MALRDFTDPQGGCWEVWSVQPTSGARDVFTGPERRRTRCSSHTPERRRTGEPGRGHVNPGFERGWLCFASGAEKRRLTPVPDDWERCSEADLWAYCRQARVVGPAAPREQLPLPS